MGRRAKDTDLGSREARSRLKPRPGTRQLYKDRLVPGRLYLGFRPSERRASDGAWYGRVYLGEGKYTWKALGAADDHHPANGKDVLDYTQATNAARKLLDEPAETSETTVGDVAKAYLEWFEHEKKSYAATKKTIDAHILPSFRDKRVVDLTKKELLAWRDKLARSPARLRKKKGEKQTYREAPATDDEKRARRASVNRIMTPLKAMLNYAVEHDLIPASAPRPWRDVKGYKGVDQPVIRFLSADESKRLINACPADLRMLVRGALLTGMRFGELADLRVAEVDTDAGRIYVAPGKTHKARHIPLDTQGVTFFKTLTTGKVGTDLVFIKKNNGRWGKNHYVRPLLDANAAAKIDPPVSFHELRHTYASSLINAGVGLPLIAALLGHADTRVTIRHYAHLADKVLREAVTRLPDLGQEPESNVEAIR